MNSALSGTKSRIREELRGLGLRATAPRVAVLNLLRESERPLSHSEVVALIDSDDWDRATIFRNLVKLVKVNLARATGHLGGIARYEAVRESDDGHSHAHFSCRACGHVSCLESTVLPQPTEAEWQQSLLDAEVQVVGVCPTCRVLNDA